MIRFLLILAVFAPAPDTSARKMAPKHPWAGFQKGDFARYKSVMETAGNRMDMGMKYTIKDINADKVSFEMETSMVIGGRENKSTVKQELSLKTGKPLKQAKQPETGVETITVPAGTFKCRWYKAEAGGNKTTTWMSPRVPGGMVKMVMTGTNKYSMELVEVKGRR